MRLSVLILCLSTAVACNGDSDSDSDSPTGDSFIDSVLDAGWASDMTVGDGGGEFSFSGDGVPDHSVLEAYALSDDTTIAVASYSLSQTIPSAPVYSATTTDTGGGVIGVAVSGGVFFNPYEGDGVTIAVDSNFYVDGVPFLDTCNGHPLPTGETYHYHGIPYCISDVIDDAGEHSSLVGLLNDGFPVYGPNGEGGTAASGLDECSGHDSATPEFPDGVYHYHFTEDQPYSIPCYHGEIEEQSGPPGP